MPKNCAMGWIFVGLITFSCSPSQDPERLEVPLPDLSMSEPFQSKDPEIDSAMQNARQTFDSFLAKASDAESTGTVFMIEIHVPTEKGPETLWLSSPQASEPGFTGYVDTIPEKIRDIAMGDEVRFSRNQIVQWQYFDAERIQGAQVTRVLRQRMTAQERNAFDASYPFPFE